MECYHSIILSASFYESYVVKIVKYQNLYLGKTLIYTERIIANDSRFRILTILKTRARIYKLKRPFLEEVSVSNQSVYKM